MYDLTQRQIDILKHIIREYIDSAEPVGSETLEKKYDLGVSPATIRNEMAEMVRLGYLSKPHASAGRIPSSKAMKFYVNELMREKELSVADEVKSKEEVWDSRGESSKFLRDVTRHLAERTKALAFATTEEGDIFYSGYSNILRMPEFYDISITENFLNMLDDFTCFSNVCSKNENDFGILLGEEFEEELLRPYGFIYSKFETRGQHSGSVGVVGPIRLKYDNIVPYVRRYGNLIEEIAEW